MKCFERPTKKRGPHNFAEASLAPESSKRPKDRQSRTIDAKQTTPNVSVATPHKGRESNLNLMNTQVDNNKDLSEQTGTPLNILGQGDTTYDKLVLVKSQLYDFIMN